jgi:ketosteroid isomerase-like protein
MTMRVLIVFVLFASLACPTQAQSVPTPSTSPATSAPAVSAEIDQLREGLVEAFTQKDADKLMTYLHPDIVVTWQNGEVSKGRDAVKAFYNRMLVGNDAVCESVSAHPVVEGRSVNGDTAISYGHMDDTFRLKDGSEFHLDSRFSAWLERDNGKWLLRGFHLSANVFDNDIQKLAVRKTATWTAFIAGAAGALAGWILSKLIRGRNKAGR